MTNKTLTEVLERVETWPADRQEQVAQILLDIERQNTSHSLLSEEQIIEVHRRLANPHRIFLPFTDVLRHFAKRGS